MTKRVLLCGVGGQGTILAAHVLAEVAMRNGFDVKVSEIHGMAQRGGSVTTVVTYGEDVHSMVSGPGESDYLVSFDKLEALRNISDLKCGHPCIVNDSVIKPQSVLTGTKQMPINMDDLLDDYEAILVPAESIAKEAGTAKASNTVMLGALSCMLEFTEQSWKDCIRENVPPKTIDLNILAFEGGRAFASEHKGSLEGANR